MNENHLSKRLERVGTFVPADSRLADIGSDHAYLPTALALQGVINFGIAGEVVEGPFKSAQNQVKKNQLEEKILVRLGDGLDAIKLEDNITVITICGMGGTLIRDILERGFESKKLSGNERLILQPNIGEYSLRIWLLEHDYAIIEEDILEENQKIYEIIVAEKKTYKQAYSLEECLFGPILKQRRGPVFVKKWQREKGQRKQVLQQLEKSKTTQTSKITAIKRELELIEEVLEDESKS